MITLKQKFSKDTGIGFITLEEFRILFPEYKGFVRVFWVSSNNVLVRPQSFELDLDHIIGTHSFSIFSYRRVDITLFSSL